MEADMAAKSELVIRVYSRRGSTVVQYVTKGRYVSFQTAGLGDTLSRQPIITTTSLIAFWSQVLAIVQADVTAGG
jgi:hypothetical protein